MSLQGLLHNLKIPKKYLRTVMVPEHIEPTQILVGALILISTFFIFLQKWNKRHLEQWASKYPGPFSLPLIGNAIQFINSDPEKLLSSLMKLGERYESPFRFWLGNKLCIVIAKPEDLQIVFNSSETLGKDELYKFAWRTIGTGLITAPVDRWRRTRKAITPAFSPKLLEQILPVFYEKSRILIQQIQQHCGSGAEIDISPYFSRMVLDSVCQTSMGVQMNTQLNQNLDFETALAKVTELLMMRVCKPWLYLDFIYNKTSSAKELDDCDQILRGFTRKIIQMKREEYDATKKLSSISNEIESQAVKKLKTFVDILLEPNVEGIQFLEEDIIDEALTFLAAGHETTTITICFCLLMLAIHPKIQAKVFEEQNELFGQSDRPITLEDLTKMEYLDQVVKETLRLFPAAPLTLRAVTEDKKLTEGLVLPAGATVVIAPLFTHKNPKLWPEPQNFKPDRFSAKNSENRHKYSFIPFNGGPRGCLGSKYSMMSVKTAVSTFIRHFEVKTTTKLEDIKLRTDLVIRSSNGWNMSLHPRIRLKS